MYIWLDTCQVNSNLETDDGSSRYLLYRNYFSFSSSATDFAMHATWLYQIENVYAYIESVLSGWGPPPVRAPCTHCYVYDGTFYLLGEHGVCRCGEIAVS